ncbi:hypothetical protein [Bradyrhizobium betae]|uniref:Neutral/alkaline non-lysosomal ceramidase N-terminal domain-containing protein n=1 Tax=Bradyrhizobium betae TaxID=244734 RepID=A0A5P6PB71_9BRAD|nr:hypothetical protein [Bradyrhizobium betae]MCS3726379.1 hypothetical protein [Bradyrhizobium betae]QFI75609.1 hypothetical protein F8237_26350 [Bradyrhizobium betae]
MISFSHGSVSIAPNRPVPLAGWAGAARVTDELFGTLEANVLVVSAAGFPRAVLISIDALFVGRKLSDAILSVCGEFSIPSSCVLIVASHTHFAPPLEADKPMLGLSCEDHILDVSRRLTNKLRALLNEGPSEGALRKGKFEIHASVNRRRPWHLPQITRDGLRFERIVLAPNEHGPTLPMITALVMTGATTCVVWGYTCHPTSFPGACISADYPGVVREALRRRFGPETTSIFLQGFAGDIRPPSPSRAWTASSALRTLLQGPRFHGMTFDEWKHWANSVADGVLRAIDLAHDAPDDFPIDGSIASIALDRLLPQAEPTRLVEMQRLSILGEEILSVSAEPVCGLEALCPKDALLVGYSRDVFGYWPSEADIALGGYEVAGFKSLFGLMGEWRTGLDQVFSEMVGSVA